MEERVVSEDPLVSGETLAIQRVSEPVTVTSLTRDLRALGIESDMTLLVHASMSRIGFVVGHSQAVVLALLGVLGQGGTLAVPTHTGHLSDPRHWQNPPVPESWWSTVKSEMPAFDPRVTASREMGAIAETVRTWPGALRSAHPQTSFAAVGRNAASVTQDHALDCELGEQSPLARLYDLDARLLLLGVGHGNNTSMHLAEYRAQWPGKHFSLHGSPIEIDGVRRWYECEDLDLDDGDFPVIGDAFDRTGGQVHGRIGAAECLLMPVRSVVDFATRWMNENRVTAPTG